MTESATDRLRRQRDEQRILLEGVPAPWRKNFPPPSAEPSMSTEIHLREAAEDLLASKELRTYLEANSRAAAIQNARDVAREVKGQGREVRQLIDDKLGNIGGEPDTPSEHSEAGEELFAFYVLASSADAVADDLDRAAD